MPLAKESASDTLLDHLFTNVFLWIEHLVGLSLDCGTDVSFLHSWVSLDSGETPVHHWNIGLLATLYSIKFWYLCYSDPLLKIYRSPYGAWSQLDWTQDQTLPIFRHPLPIRTTMSEDNGCQRITAAYRRQIFCRDRVLEKLELWKNQKCLRQT